MAALTLEGAAPLEPIKCCFHLKEIACAPIYAAKHFYRRRKTGTAAHTPERCAADAEATSEAFQWDEIVIHG